jgi:hypothetical protein
MSEWPKRYITDTRDEDIGGDLVSLYDFNDLLDYTVEAVRRSPRFDWVNPPDLKDAVLRDIEIWRKAKGYTRSIE